MDTATPARLYALVFGLVLVAAGILGFFYSSDFGDPGDVDGVLGVAGLAAGVASPGAAHGAAPDAERPA